MKPAWDKLMGEFEGSTTAVVADVDCTAGGKDLCSAHGVRGYPSIKYGDVSDLQDYKGGRDFDSLLEFAKSNLGPTCSPNNLDLCDAEQTAAIEKAQAMSDEELETAIEDGDSALEQAEVDFKSAVEELQKQYEALMKAKDDTIADVKSRGLGVLKSVRAARASAAASGGHDEL